MFKSRIPSALAFAGVRRYPQQKPYKPRFKLVRSTSLEVGDGFYVRAGDSLPFVRLRSTVTPQFHAVVTYGHNRVFRQTIYLGEYVLVRIG